MGRIALPMTKESFASFAGAPGLSPDMVRLLPYQDDGSCYAEIAKNGGFGGDFKILPDGKVYEYWEE